MTQWSSVTVVEIELERNERHALALDRADQLVDLPAVHQQLARPLRRMIEAVRLKIFRDVRVDEPDLAAARVGIGLGDRRLPEPQRFHFGPGQRDARFHRLVDEVIETRLAVVSYHAPLLFRFRHGPVSGLSECRGFP
jgi:hypothetical protein